jgi:hypothetical protein
MAPNTFDRDVPPLKSNRSLNCSMVKTCFSVRQTQRSFSTTASETHAVGGLAEQFRPAGRVKACDAVQTKLREFLRHSIDPVDSEASVFQSCFLSQPESELFSTDSARSSTPSLPRCRSALTTRADLRSPPASD